MTYVLSDIHGNLHNFNSILEQIQLKPEDNLYVLGDVIDRYPDGIEILKIIMEMPNAHMLLGNHEYMMLNALGVPYEENVPTNGRTMRKSLRLWYSNGGAVTHYAWNAVSESECEAIIRYLGSLPLNMDIDVDGRNFKLVHGTATEIYDVCSDFIRESRTAFCVWDRESVLGMADVEQFITVFGHSPTAYFQNANPLKIFRYKNVIGIDCGSGWPAPNNELPIQGRLACLRLEDMREFYSE